MKCENNNCNKEHDGKFGSGRFCCISCSNTRIRTPEVKERIRQSMKNTWDATSETGKQIKLDALAKGRIARKENRIKYLQETPVDLLSHKPRKQKVFNEQGSKCNKCGLSKWLGNPITFKLEHIDGDRNNNFRYNLEVLCPNSHAQTDTWRGRNNNRY